MARRRRAAGLFALLLLAGCAGGPGPGTVGLLDQAEAAGFTARLAGGPLLVPAWARLQAPGAPVRVYIEGDGHAWVTRSRPAHDPTPRNPVALRLALADQGPNLVYLGRPCQYAARTHDAACEPRLWTSHRYAPEVVRSALAALDALLPAGAAPVELVGYSGGGALALLMAAERPGAFRVTTIAGVLDHAAWTAHHRDSPLDGSLNPAAFAGRLAAVPQRHFVGGRDATVPPAIAESYARRLAGAPCLTVIRVAAATHESGWDGLPPAWPAGACGGG